MNLKAVKRDTKTSGALNKLRSSGFIPAILYGGKNPNEKISIEKQSILSVVKTDTFLSKVLELDMTVKRKGLKRSRVSRLSEEPIHIDFMRIIP